MSRDDLLERLRQLFEGNPDVVEKRMVGGRSFSLLERMFCGVTSAGLVVRVGAGGVAAALEQPHVSRLAMGRRAVAAFVVIAPEGVAGEQALAAWVQRGLDTVRDETAPIPGGTPAERFAELVDHFTGAAGVMPPEPSGARGFGSSALRVDGSIFAMMTRDRLVVKLSASRVSALIQAGAGEPFTAGRTTPLREWLTLGTDDPSTWLALAQEALAFVRSGVPVREGRACR